MKKRLFKKFIIFIFMILVAAVVLIKMNNNKFNDTITYNGKTYVLLEYNMDIFNYNFNSNDYYEEDTIHPIFHNKWDVIYFSGDLFVLDKQVEKATKYYSNDNNYNWFITFEEEDSEIKIPISISKEELNYLYNMEIVERKQTMTFDDIKQFASIEKISEDGFVKSLINLVNCDDFWYWKTEVMTDNDEEYIIVLPDSLNDKIFALLDK